MDESEEIEEKELLEEEQELVSEAPKDSLKTITLGIIKTCYFKNELKLILNSKWAQKFFELKLFLIKNYFKKVLAKTNVAIFYLNIEIFRRNLLPPRRKPS